MKHALVRGGIAIGGIRFAFADDVPDTHTPYLPILLTAALACTPLPARLWTKLGLDARPVGAVLEPLLCLGVLVLCVAALASHSYNPFLYFRF